ncbi:MAG: hypothetical protein ABIA74_04930 [bacterium]
MKKLILLLPFLVAGLSAKSTLEQKVDLLEKGFNILVEKVTDIENRLSGETENKRTNNRSNNETVKNTELKMEPVPPLASTKHGKVGKLGVGGYEIKVMRDGKIKKS